MARLVIFHVDENCQYGNYWRMEKLREWRRTNGKSLEEAGNLIGVTGVQWHRYESGARRVPGDKAIMVESVTGVSRHELRPDIFGPTPSGQDAAA